MAVGGVVGAGFGLLLMVGMSYYGSKAFDNWYDNNVAEHVDHFMNGTKDFFSDVGDSVFSWFNSLGTAV